MFNMFYEEILLNMNTNILKYKHVIFQTMHHRQRLLSKIFNTVFNIHSYYCNKD